MALGLLGCWVVAAQVGSNEWDYIALFAMASPQ
jgi:hypothetical protein